MGKGTETVPSSDRPLGIFLIDDCYRRSQPTMGSTTSGQMALGCITKQAEQGSSQRSASVPAASFLPEFLLRLPSMVNVNWEVK